MANYKRFNIAKAEKYTKDGKENTAWRTVGTLIEFVKQDGSVSRIIEIPAIGLKANVFEEKPRGERNPNKVDALAPDERSQEVDPNDLPF